MERIALAVCALLAFLLPIGFYCLILASINRRPRPVLVSGLWDAIGLLFALSGFFLVTAPMLFSEFIARSLLTEGVESPLGLWLQHWIMYAAYFLFVLCGGALLMCVRTRKTMIYNVDVEQFTKVLETALANSGLSAQGDHHRRLSLTPAVPAGENTSLAPSAATVASERRHAELKIDTFASMCHVTLHWEKATPALREQIETELNKTLESAVPLENPSAGWFLNIGGMIFGALVMVVLTFVVVVIMLTWR